MIQNLNRKSEEVLSDIEMNIFLFLSKQPKGKTYDIKQIAKELSSSVPEIEDEILTDIINNLIGKKMK